MLSLSKHGGQGHATLTYGLLDAKAGCHVDVLETSRRRPLQSPFEQLRVIPVFYIISFFGILRIFESRNGGSILFLFCLFFSMNALAQKGDTTHKDESTIKIITNAPAPQKNKPLIVINGVIYKGDIGDINPDNILSIDVLKNPGATNIYGPIGANGAVLITTKKKYQKADTTNKAKPLDSAVNKDALFIVDGQPSKNKLNDINANDILSIDILKKSEASDPSFSPVNDVVIVVTKAKAIQQYQKKFSAFSKKYKSYLDAHQNNDEGFVYVLDGIQVQGTRNDIIKKLYKIPSEKIKEVGFNKKQPTDGSATLVIINTKP